MGVDVRVWGRIAWDLFYMLADLLDARGVPYDSYFAPLRWILPCFYCRDSVVPFYTESKRLYPGSARGMVRYLHALVKQKLENQERGLPVGYGRPSQKNLDEANYEGPSRFDMGTLERFLYYAMCDTGNGVETLKWVGHVLDLVDPQLGVRWRSYSAIDPQTLMGRLKAVCGTFNWGTKPCTTFSMPEAIVGYHPSMLTRVDKKWIA